jgi:GDPmannose 4,6-dehydratase
VTKRALITGAAGQDGRFLSELLLGKGYEVWGIVGPAPGSFLEWARGFEGLHPVDADLADMGSMLAVVEASRPDEVYNFAAISSVGESWDSAVLAAEVNGIGVVRLMESLRLLAPGARMFQASSAEMFGDADEVPQCETTPHHPLSPYAIAKSYAHNIVASYRRSFAMHASNGILYNHESSMRGLQFVTRKITDGAARIKLGLADELRLGNLDARRDWGFAGDYVEAMWLMLQQERPDDYVIASGEAHSIRDFCEVAFSYLGLDYQQHVVVDPAFFRPVDPHVQCGDPTKAQEVLGWRREMSFRELVETMVDADLAALEDQLAR